MAHILFVEDEKWGVLPYFKALEQHDHHCDLALSGKEAERKLSLHSYDLISLDLMFNPVEDDQEISPTQAGLMMLKKIRSGKIKNCDPNIKIIILTAVINIDLEKKAKALGITMYLKKPIEFEKVIKAILDHVE